MDVIDLGRKRTEAGGHGRKRRDPLGSVLRPELPGTVTTSLGETKGPTKAGCGSECWLLQKMVSLILRETVLY